MTQSPVNRLKLAYVALASGILAAGIGGMSTLMSASSHARPATIAALPAPWQPATPQETDEVMGYLLQSPSGIAALNQLAIEGYISPLCERHIYTHTEFGSFQSLLQVQCPTPRGVDIARAYDEMRVTLNRFEDVIISFTVERIYIEGEGEDEINDPVSEAAIQAAARRFGVDSSRLSIVERERRTWSDSCLGLGGPAESCLAALTPGWQVVVTDGASTWLFRTNEEASQVRFESQRSDGSQV